ncbi:hypothetical protein LX32DRAFT_710171 [Colletotrichum zoysiae]|uniref:Uncharacterized protein n=1 Tax=Colletotrichum zoysiae TaxID=1216348 RepID=A0AAD9H629_9PEZI|nr:hypothetical protein LX32DRAFT_710171 [Colletotrichum zoysiae]
MACAAIAVQRAYEWRRVLEDLLPSIKPFCYNCVGFLVTLMPTSDAVKEPFSHLALAIRRSITEQGTRDQVKTCSSLVRRDPRTKSPHLFGRSSMELLTFLNWQKASIDGFNLSAAAIHARGIPLNYWLSDYKVEREWGVPERQMKGDS